MNARTSRGVLGLTTVAVAALVAGLLTAPATAAPPTRTGTVSQAPDPQRPVLPEDADDRARMATEAYERAREIFADDERSGHARDATIVLRDLKKYEDALTARQREDMGTWRSSAWKSSYDRPRNARCAENRVAVIHCNDRPGAGVSPVGVRRMVGHVHLKYTGAGYRAPRRDDGGGRFGPNKKVDIYVKDLGTGLYGFCSTDEPKPGHYGVNVWSYCVVNSNYSWSGMSNTKAMRATLAHEYFHAVQFAYDYYEDGWFMESTATWAEERVYDGINDNRQYLRHSPLRTPARPMAKFDSNTYHHYGGWIFWEFLAQRFGYKKNGMETIVRDTWRRSDPARNFSLKSLRLELRHDRRMGLRNVFAHFADANRRPVRAYPEGGSAGYKRAPTAGRAVLENVGESRRFVRPAMKQLSAKTFVYKPNTVGKRGVLRLNFNLPPKWKAGKAVVTIYKKNGNVNVRRARLDRQGKGRMGTDFASSRVRRVDVTLVNASSKMKECSKHYAPSVHWPCDGRPKYNGPRGVVKGTVQRR